LHVEDIAMTATRSERYRWARSLAIASLLLAATPGAQAEARQYQIDPAHFTVGFLVEHVGFAKVLGMFREASGSYRFDEETGTLSDVSIVIRTDSLFTNEKKRDEHLRGPDFFNVAEFPEITFVAATATTSDPRTYAIEGELTLLGVTRPLALTATWNKSGESPVGGLFNKPYVMGVSVRGTLTRSAFGMTYAVSNGWVGDDVELIIELEAIRK
jgi:polyisoprenoid-binding protein YceI